MEEPLELIRFQDHHLELFGRWLRLDHVRPWFDPAEDWLLEIEHRHDRFSFIHHWIVVERSSGREVGFCQDYLCADADEDDYRMYPAEGTHSIDYLVGDPADLGRGYGKRIVDLLVRRLSGIPGAARIVVKPDEDNRRSIGTLLATGFAMDPAAGAYLLPLPAHPSARQRTGTAPIRGVATPRAPDIQAKNSTKSEAP